MLFKYVENKIIVYLGEGDKAPANGVKLTKEKYAELLAKTKTAPKDTLEYCYRLSNETEEYIAIPRTHEETVDWYVQAVSSGEMAIEGVPEDYRAEVEERLPQPEEQKYTLDEAAEVLAQEVSQNGYDT